MKMKIERVNRYLKSVGKACFVRYFELFNDDSVQNHEIAETIKEENGYTDNSCNSRTGHARMIIQEGGAEDALKIITESRRLDIGVIRQAEKLLKEIT